MMHPRVRLLGIAKILHARGEPIPLDILVQADELGLSLAQFQQPDNETYNDNEGDDFHGENPIQD